MGGAPVPYEKRAKIAEMYQKGMRVTEIAAELNLPRSTVNFHVARGRGGTPTHCPECHGAINPSLKVQFCYLCGADLRSEGVKLVPRVKDVIKHMTAYYPASLRDEAVQTLNKVIDILKEA